MLYELRIYDVHPGKMQAIQDRFRDYVIPLFSKHGMRVTHFWEDEEKEANRLYYLVEHADKETRDLNYTRFRNDPEWHEVRRITEQDGPLVNKQESVFMTQTAFFKNNN